MCASSVPWGLASPSPQRFYLLRLVSVLSGAQGAAGRSSPLHCRGAYVEPGHKTRPLSWRCGPGVFRILTLLSSKQDSEGRCLVAPGRPVAMRALRDSRNRRPQPRPTEAPGGYRMPQASSKDPGGQWIRTPEGAPPRASPPLCPGQRCAAHARLGAHPPRQGGPG